MCTQRVLFFQIIVGVYISVHKQHFFPPSLPEMISFPLSGHVVFLLPYWPVCLILPYFAFILPFYSPPFSFSFPFLPFSFTFSPFFSSPFQIFFPKWHRLIFPSPRGGYFPIYRPLAYCQLLPGGTAALLAAAVARRLYLSEWDWPEDLPSANEQTCRQTEIPTTCRGVEWLPYLLRW